MIHTPQDVIALAGQQASKKYLTPMPRLILLGVLAGAYIAIGGLLATMASAGTMGLGVDNPFVPKLLGGMLFPLGLMLVVLVGGELFTGNTATLVPATLSGEIPRTYWLKNWTIVYLTNFVGALLVSYFIAYQTGILQGEVYTTYIQRVAEAKVSLGWEVAFWRGVGANWLVCLAVWLGLSARDMLGRLVGLWWPVMAFVAIGFEHSIANMHIIPTAIFYGAEVSWSSFVWDNLVPVTLGNIVGGALLVGMAYAYAGRPQSYSPLPPED